MRDPVIKMKVCAVLFITLVVFISVQGTSAQYDEVCHWQCDVIHCDYYSDYCDYDCYEVCYPMRVNFEPVRQIPVGRTPKPHTSQQVLKAWSASPPSGGQFVTQTSKQQKGSSTGKTIRMRIENPTFQKVQAGRVVATKGSTPRAFALMQTCLSNRLDKRSIAPIRNPSEKHDDSILLQPIV